MESFSDTHCDAAPKIIGEVEKSDEQPICPSDQNKRNKQSLTVATLVLRNVEAKIHVLKDKRTESKVRYCAVASCKNTRKNSTLSFFQFPKHDLTRLEQWRRNLGPLKSDLKTNYVCSDHFGLESFTDTFRRRLHCVAVPKVIIKEEKLHGQSSSPTDTDMRNEQSITATTLGPRNSETNPHVLEEKYTPRLEQRNLGPLKFDMKTNCISSDHSGMESIADTFKRRLHCVAVPKVINETLDEYSSSPVVPEVIYETEALDEQSSSPAVPELIYGAETLDEQSSSPVVPEVLYEMEALDGSPTDTDMRNGQSAITVATLLVRDPEIKVHMLKEKHTPSMSASRHHPYCAVLSCKNTKENCKLSFFRFPKNDPTRLEQWRRNLGPLKSELKFNYVCSDHFGLEAFPDTFKRRLHCVAVPKVTIKAEKLDGQSSSPTETDMRNEQSVMESTLALRNSETIPQAPEEKYTPSMSALQQHRYCLVVSCKNNIRNSEVSFFKIPENDPVRLKQWMENLGPLKSDSKNRYICSDHFGIESFTDSSRRRLRSVAIPKVIIKVEKLDEPS